MSEHSSPDELKSRLRLSDGRMVYRDGRGRYREVGTGLFVAAADAAQAEPAPPARSFSQPLIPDSQPDDDAPPQTPEWARDAARHGLMAAVADAGSAEEAWARIVAVQAAIALDREAGSRATAAARLVAQAAGMLPEGKRKDDDTEKPEGSDVAAEEALHILASIRTEEKKRDPELPLADS